MNIGQVIADEEIVIGDKVDMVTQKGAVYRTMIEDKLENGAYLAGIPNRKGTHMDVYTGDDIYMVFYRDTGRYIAQMKVVALENRGGIRYMWLAQKTVAQKNQRRDAFRLEVSFEVQIFEYVDDAEQGLEIVTDEVNEPAIEVVSSRDISVTGVALLTRKKYELDDRYLLSMHLGRSAAHIRSNNPDRTPALQITAAVKRCIPWRTANTFNTGMHFLGLTDSMSDGIARYVLAEQQKQIKRRRLL